LAHFAVMLQIGTIVGVCNMGDLAFGRFLSRPVKFRQRRTRTLQSSDL